MTKPRVAPEAAALELREVSKTTASARKARVRLTPNGYSGWLRPIEVGPHCPPGDSWHPAGLARGILSALSKWVPVREVIRLWMGRIAGAR